MWVTTLLLALPCLTAAAQLNLGSSCLRDCAADAAHVAYISTPTVKAGDLTPVKAVLNHVPATCAGSSMDIPCASVDTDRPARFWCVWTGTTGSIVNGPYQASATPEYRGEESVGTWKVWVDCTPPIISEMAMLGWDGATEPYTAQLSIGFSASSPSGTSAALPSPGAILDVSFSGLVSPSPPPPSPAPPPEAPPPGAETDCATWKAKGYSASGEYMINPCGQAFLAYCDMDTFDGGWTRFNWMAPTAVYPAGNADPFQYTLSECNPAQEIGRCRIPSCLNPSYFMSKANPVTTMHPALSGHYCGTRGGGAAYFTFDNSPISNAVLGAVRDKVPASLSNLSPWAVQGRTGVVDGCAGTSNSQGGCDSFYYNSGSSPGTNLDDDNGWGWPVFKFGDTGYGGNQDFSFLQTRGRFDPNCDTDQTPNTGALFWR